MRWAVALLALAAPAAAQSVASAPAQPVAPPAGATPLFEVIADGVQIYTCEPRDARPVWVFKAPDATLFDAGGRQVGTHGAGPHWQLGDGSRVTGAVVGNAPAPIAGAIPWLLLRATPTDAPGALRNAAWVRRFDTVGGVAPAEGCDAARIGETARMRYSARYGFFAER